MLCVFMREEKLRKGKRGEECCDSTNSFGECLRRYFITRVAIDCSAIDHEVIDRNEISIVNVHSC